MQNEVRPHSHGEIDLSLVSVVGAASLLSACGGGGAAGSEAGAGSGSGTGTGTGTGTGGNVDYKIATNYPNANTDEEAARFLQQAQFSSAKNEIAAVRSKTYVQWLSGEFNRAQGQNGWDWLEAKGYGVMDANTYCFNYYPADFMLWNQLIASPDPMRKRFALALSEFFVVGMTGLEFNWRSHAIAAYWDILVTGAYGNFRQLLELVTLSPAMGYYLNTKGNQKANPATGRVPDENYAREVMQLFTIGLYQLNLDGTVKTDSAGKKLDSYTQNDIMNLARAFTGYDFDSSDGVRHLVTGQTYTIESTAFTKKNMAVTASKHSGEAMTFLGSNVAANASASVALTQALDTLFNHANVGPFFARQMIQRLVKSNPSPAYVARVAGKFNNNGAGVRGDLKAVWSAILLDDEARGPSALTDNTSGKLREPMVRFIQWARTFGLSSAAGTWKLGNLDNASSQLGQSPLRSPSVFNFFRPGYIPGGTAMATSSSTAPEFQITNETTLGGYLNYMQAIIKDGISVNDPNLPQPTSTNAVRDIQPNYAAELALVTDASALVNHLNLVMAAGQIPSDTRTLMINALNATSVVASSTDAVKLNRVAAAVLMVLASAEYLVQR